MNFFVTTRFQLLSFYDPGACWPHKGNEEQEQIPASHCDAVTACGWQNAKLPSPKTTTMLTFLRSFSLPSVDEI
jgi:hypothetical protein